MQEGYKSIDFINLHIRLNETHETLNKLKAKKQQLLMIHYEIFKNVTISDYLYHFLNTCFQYNVMPSK